jgi:hypothetical protein
LVCGVHVEVDQRAGERHDDFGRNRDAARVQRDEPCDAGITTGADDVNDKLKYECDDLFAHERTQYKFRLSA